MRHAYYRIGNLFPFLRKYRELHGLPVGIDDIVAHERHYKQHHEAIHDFVNAMEQHIGTRNNNNVGIHYHAPDCHIAVFRYHRGYDIAASRTAIVHECYSHSQAAHQRAQYHIHEGLLLHYRCIKKRLKHTENKLSTVVPKMVRMTNVFPTTSSLWQAI